MIQKQKTGLPVNKKEIKLKGTAKALEKKEYIAAIAELAEILKNNKIDQIIVAGEKISDPEALSLNPKSKEKIISMSPDLDAKTALYLFNNYSNRLDKDTYNDNAKSTIIGKDGSGLDTANETISEKSKKLKVLPLNSVSQENKIRLFIDVGGKWPSVNIEKDGETKTLYFDHHGPGQREATSGTKIVLDIMKQAGLLKDLPPWLNKFTDFVTDIDNLSYLNKKNSKGQKIFNENYFRNEWPNSLYAIAEKQIPYATLIKLAEDGIIKDFDRPFTKEELDGQIGQTKIGQITIKELCQKQKSEVVDNLENGIKNAISHNKKEGLNLDKTVLGKIIYHNYFIKKNRKSNVIFDHLAFKATIAKGYDTYISYDRLNKKAFINSLNPKLSKIVEKLNEAEPGCAIDIRGVMVSVKFDKMTEEEFLNIIDPKILANKIDKIEELPKLMELDWTEEEAQKELDDILLEIEQHDLKLKDLEKELSDSNSTNQEPENMKNKKTNEELPETIPDDYLKSKFLPFLKGLKEISEVKSLKVKTLHSTLNIESSIIASGFKIDIELTIESKDGILKVKNHSIDANWMVKGKAKEGLEPSIKEIPKLIKSYIEEKLNRKVEKIWIEDGELKAQ